MATKQCACATELYTLKRLNGKFNIFYQRKKEEGKRLLYIYQLDAEDFGITWMEKARDGIATLDSYVMVSRLLMC